MRGLGVVGAGGIAARRMLPALARLQSVRLRAVMDADAEVAAAVAARFGAERATTRLEDLLEDDGVDAVYIASPVDAHARQARQALRSGRPVLLEKPLARDAREAETIVEQARLRRSSLKVGFMMRFHPLHARLRALVHEGAIGRPVAARARLTCDYPPIAGAWRQDPARGGGGSLLDLGVHALDLLTWVLGPARRVAALTGKLVHAYAYAVEDTATLLVELEGGVQATLEAHFSVADGTAPALLEVLGTDGALAATGTLGQTRDGTLVLRRRTRGGYDALQETRHSDEETFAVGEAGDLYADELTDFLEDGKVGCDGAQALAVQRIADAAYASARTGTMVAIVRD